MAQTIIKETTLESGQEVYEAVMPHDTTIVARVPKKSAPIVEIEPQELPENKIEDTAENVDAKSLQEILLS